jgi:serine protease Do
MRSQILTAIAVLPFLVGFSRAGQTAMDASEPFGISSEDSGPSSYLGVDIADITSDRLGTLKLKEEKGVEVTMVDQDAPAGKAGVKEHDVIVSMNGMTVESKTQLQRMIHETPPGRVVTLGLSRDGQPLMIKVQLADRRSEFRHVGKSKDGDFHFEIPQLPHLPDFDIPNIDVVYVHSSTRSGLMVENLTPQLSEFFGAKNGDGVLVRSVEKGSGADRAGLRAGDVIVRVGDQTIHDTSDFTHVLRSRNPGSVNVEVIRDRKPQTVTITLPARKESGDMIKESFETPEADAESRAELSEALNQVAKLRPQIELAREEARKASVEMRKSVCEQQRLMREQARKRKKEVDSEVQKELLKSREKLQKEMEELRKEMPTHSLDI